MARRAATVIVSYATLPKDLADVEAHIDNALDRLRVYRLPLPSAISHCLQAFQLRYLYECELSSSPPHSDASLLHLKDALEILMPKLTEHCSQSTAMSGLVLNRDGLEYD